MLIQLQTAYGQALKNLVFVDFVNKKVIGGLESLELEHAKESACCKDLITAINKHFRDGNFVLVKERIEVLTNRADYANRLEVQIKEYRRNKLFEIASQLDIRGKLVKVVRLMQIRVKCIKNCLIAPTIKQHVISSKFTYCDYIKKRK